MSMMKNLVRELEPEMKKDLPKKCSFCGDNPASGVWFGKDVIGCCQPCALTKVPLLIADAIGSSRTLTRSAMVDAACRVDGSLWRGLALAAVYGK